MLHVDKNSYYGGCEAAFSLPEAEEWVNVISKGKMRQNSLFETKQAFLKLGLIVAD